MRNPLTRSLTKFMEEPASPLRAARVIVVATAIATILGAIVVRFFDTSDVFDDFDNSIWFSLQTVTTVGYGDIVPTTILGRIVAAFVMLFGIAFTAVVTAAITSTFVEAARRRAGEHDAEEAQSSADALHGRLDELAARLERIERRLIEASAPGGPADRP